MMTTMFNGLELSNSKMNWSNFGEMLFAKPSVIHISFGRNQSITLTYHPQLLLKYLPQTWYELQETLQHALPVSDTYRRHQTFGRETTTAERNSQLLYYTRLFNHFEEFVYVSQTVNKV